MGRPPLIAGIYSCDSKFLDKDRRISPDRVISYSGGQAHA